MTLELISRALTPEEKAQGFSWGTTMVVRGPSVLTDFFNSLAAEQLQDIGDQIWKEMKE